MNLSDIRVRNVDPERAFKILPNIEEVVSVEDFFKGDFEVEEVDFASKILSDNFYLLPTQFENDYNDQEIGYALFHPGFKQISTPFYIIGSGNELVDLYETEFPVNSENISFECLVNEKYLQDKSQYYSLLYRGDTKGLILWEEFIPTDIIPNVAYQFQLIGREDVNTILPKLKQKKS